MISNDYREKRFETRLTKIYSEYTGDKPTELRPQLHKTGMFDLFFNPALLDIIEMILGSEIRLYPNYTVRDKMPNSEMDPGDVVLFSNLLFHCGLPNQSSHIRWSVDWRYQDATQSTARKAKGHIARSRSNPASAVQDARDWAGRSFV